MSESKTLASNEIIYLSRYIAVMSCLFLMQSSVYLTFLGTTFITDSSNFFFKYFFIVTPSRSRQPQFQDISSTPGRQALFEEYIAIERKPVLVVRGMAHIIMG